MVIQDVMYTTYYNLRNCLDEPVRNDAYGPAPVWTPLA